MFNFLSPVPNIFHKLNGFDKQINSLKKEINPSEFNNKAVIVCNGPSLLETDLSLLKNVFSVGLNKINLLFDKVEWRPNLIISVNPLVIKQNWDFFVNSNIPVILDYRYSKKSKKVYYVCSKSKKIFYEDITKGINQGYTVTYAAMQVLFYLGFKKVTLVGCDHNFFVDKNVAANKKKVMNKLDVNHFDKNYFAIGQQWHTPDLINSEFYYSIAKKNYEENNRVLTNSTIQGKLEIFERIPLKDWVLDNQTL